MMCLICVQQFQIYVVTLNNKMNWTINKITIKLKGYKLGYLCFLLGFQDILLILSTLRAPTYVKY